MTSSFLKYAVLLQKYRTPILILSCSGVFIANMSYHTFPEISFRLLYQAWHKGQPVSLSEKLQCVFQEVLKDYGISSPNNYTSFASFGFHPVAAGVPWFPAGAQIGIPENFNSTVGETDGITNRTILINGKTVQWESESGTTLRNALVFSAEAQKFAIAREVARLNSGGQILSAAVAPVCLGGVWVYSVLLKQVFSLHAGPALFRGVANLVALGLGAVSYFLTSDAVSQWVDYSSDRRAAGVSRDYAEGGVEFYGKILSRNRTLRTLMGRKGEEMYAPSGNLFPAHLLQLKHAPYSSRRDRILGLLKEDKA